MNLNVRPFAETDLKSVIRLWAQCGLVVPWNNPEADIARKLKVDPSLFLVGLRESRIVATVMGGYEGHRGWLNYLAVEPSAQGMGCGRIMVAKVEKLLLARGCPKINLQVRTSNEDVIHFYGALGYKVDDVVSMGKRLIKDKLPAD